MSRRKEKEKEKGEEGRLHLAGSLFSSSIDFKAGVFLPSAHRSHAKTSSFGENAARFKQVPFTTNPDRETIETHRETFNIYITYEKTDKKDELGILISGIGNTRALHGVKDYVVKDLQRRLNIPDDTLEKTIQTSHKFVCSNPMESTCTIIAKFPFAAENIFNRTTLGTKFIPMLLGCNDVKNTFTMPSVFGTSVSLGYMWVKEYSEVFESSEPTDQENYKLVGNSFVWKSTDFDSELLSVPIQKFV